MNAKTFTLKQFTQQSNIDAKLVRAVVSQIGGWSEFKELAQDVYNSGANAGWVGFTYYTDTVDFYKRNKKAILTLAASNAEDYGYDSTLDLVASFGCLRGTTKREIMEFFTGLSDECEVEIKNALAWFALEEVCRSYCDLVSE